MSQQTVPIPDKSSGQSYTAAEFNTQKGVIDNNANDANSRLVPGISIANLSTPKVQALGTTYSQICLTDTLLFESPPGIIETTYPLGCDSVKMVKGGLVKLETNIYVEGQNNVELYIKAYKNGSEITPGDPAGVNLQGPGKLVVFPFTAYLPTSPGDIITYYARLESAGNFTIRSNNLAWSQTNYI